MINWLEKTFRLKANQTTLRRECLGGVTTFASMAYILAVNPLILAEAGMPREALITVTALAAVFGCLLMAFLANYPIALAPGMGTNAYFAFIICLGMDLPWQAALALTFWNGVLFLLLSLSGWREKLILALPEAIKIGIQAGIGFFIAFIGLKNAGLVIDHPATLVSLGDFSQPEPWLALAGLLGIGILMLKKVAGAILTGILALSLVGLWIPSGETTLTQLPETWLQLPFSINETFLQLDWLYPFREFSGETLSILLTLLILDLFDSIGTLVGVSKRAGFLRPDGSMPRINRALTSDALATMGGALLGTSTTTAYIESSTGIESGARTGLASVVTGLCFLLSLLATPLILMVPAVATAPALILVGVLMAESLRALDFDHLEEYLPAILTMLMIPLTFSITDGIGIGLLAYTGLHLAQKKKKIPILTHLLAGAFLIYFAVL
jgi:adenine/guanine/hypoxanthine permease